MAAISETLGVRCPTLVTSGIVCLTPLVIRDVWGDAIEAMGEAFV